MGRAELELRERAIVDDDRKEPGTRAVSSESPPDEGTGEKPPSFPPPSRAPVTPHSAASHRGLPIVPGATAGPLTAPSGDPEAPAEALSGSPSSTRPETPVALLVSSPSAAAEPLSSASTSAPDVARAAGRGGLAIAFAKVYFILAGLVQQVALPRVLGLDGYGALSSALSIASITYNPVVTTSIQGVSRAVAQSPDAEQPEAVRRVFSLHAVFAVLLAAAFFFMAETLGQRIGAPHIVPALEVLSFVLFGYGLYTPLVGVLNGKKRFVHQAGLDILAATLRTLGLIGGAMWLATTGFGPVTGASAGFVGSALAMFFVALGLTGLGRRGKGGPTVKEHLAFLAPLLVGHVLFNLLLQADLTLLRYFAAGAATAEGLPLTAADPYVGAYRATQLFCFLPYQLLIAVTFILFPMLATAYRDGDRAAVARYVKTGVRLALVLMGLMVSVSSGLSGPLLRLVFGPEVARLATRTMELLTLGFGAFAILGILTTVLNSLKRERVTTLINFLAFSLIAILCWARVRGGPFGEELMWRTAIATSTGLVAATLGASVVVWKTAGAVAPLGTVVRVLFGLGLAVSLGRVLPEGGKVMTLVASGLVASAYLAVLLVSRELGRDDLELVLRVVRGRNARAR